MFRKNISDWIFERQLYGIRVFSEDDPCDLPKGWEKPSDLSLTAIAVFGPDGFLLFTDEIYSLSINRNKIELRNLDAFPKWYEELEPKSIIAGYNMKSLGFDLIRSKIDLDFRGDLRYCDLLEWVQDMTAKHYESYPRRIPLAALAHMNNIRKFAIPLPSVITSALTLVAMWRKENKAGVMKNLLNEANLITRILWDMECNDGSLLIRDERTDKKVRVTSDDFAFLTDKIPEDR